MTRAAFAILLIAALIWVVSATASGQRAPATVTPGPSKTPAPATPQAYLPMLARYAALIQDPPGYYTLTPFPLDRSKP